MLEKTIAIGNKQVKFRSSATIPRLYRVKFKRDIFKDYCAIIGLNQKDLENQGILA